MTALPALPADFDPATASGYYRVTRDGLTSGSISYTVALWHGRKAGNDDLTSVKKILSIRYSIPINEIIIDTMTVHSEPF